MKPILFCLYILISISGMPVLASNNNPTGEIFIFTSPIDYRTMNPITAGTISKAVSKITKNSLFVPFNYAYGNFFSDVEMSIRKAANENGYDGVANLVIRHSVTDDTYYFSATYDYWKFSK